MSAFRNVSDDDLERLRASYRRRTRLLTPKERLRAFTMALTSGFGTLNEKQAAAFLQGMRCFGAVQFAGWSQHGRMKPTAVKELSGVAFALTYAIGEMSERDAARFLKSLLGAETLNVEDMAERPSELIPPMPRRPVDESYRGGVKGGAS